MVGPDSREGAVDPNHFLGEEFAGMFQHHYSVEVVSSYLNGGKVSSYRFLDIPKEDTT